MIPKLLKSPFYKVLKYVINSDLFRREIWYAIKDVFVHPPIVDTLRYEANPYSRPVPNLLRNKREIYPIFITGRFRSGSTFLWMIFRNLPGVTAYYEPLNENKWFLRQNFKVDPTHIGVNNYWAEYDEGLDFLGSYFKNEWTYRKLYMTEKDYDLKLYKYISHLIKAAKGRPVLQFNRIDFRLPWVKANFPNARILHIIRNPREQWMSILKDGGPISQNFRIKAGEEPNLFYTIAWGHDLKTIFPFLEPVGEHPYKIHYYLWRLSYIFGKTYADYKIMYESLISDFEAVIENLFDSLKIEYDSDLILRLETLNKGYKPERWRSYAPIEWFEEIENECERSLQAFFSRS